MEEKVEELNRKEKEMKAMGEDLLKLLDTSLDRLWKNVEADIPINREARKASIIQAEKVLNDYDANLLRKTRSVFDVLARETDMGYSVESREDDIDTEEGPKRVTLLRIGRVGLFAVTPDREKAYQWNQEKDKWLVLENDLRSLDEAVDTVKGIRLVGLKRLPVEKPEKGVKVNAVEEGGKTVEKN